MAPTNLFGKTPLNDVSGLIPRHISTATELDDLEFANINKAAQKYFVGRATDKQAPFTVSWLFAVHKEMFGEVWKWAGLVRKGELNIGVEVVQIREQLKQLVDNFLYWQSQDKMDLFESAARLHHGLVKIHPFTNGNGRWARFVTNIYLTKKASTYVNWPEQRLKAEGLFRKKYIQALLKADQGLFEELIVLHKSLGKKRA